MDPDALAPAHTPGTPDPDVDFAVGGLYLDDGVRIRRAPAVDLGADLVKAPDADVASIHNGAAITGATVEPVADPSAAAAE